VKPEQILRWSDPLRRMPVAVRYVAACAIVLMFFGLRALLGPAMGGYPFLLFFPAIILISALLDRGTGVFAVILSATLAWYFFVPPARSFALPDWTNALPLALYVVVGLFLALSIEALRTLATRLAATSAQLAKIDALNKLLLVDINHRVKNHLTSVNALLRLSFRDIADPAAHDAMNAATARINVLGKLYSNLHLSDATSSVCARDFIGSLCEDLRAGVIGLRPITLTVSADEAQISAHQAVPLGLIINELVENALKYAFPDDRRGVIAVRFAVEDDLFVLSVADDGIGFDPQASRVGGGTRLVRALTQQLNAQLDPVTGPGTTVRLSFAPEPAP